ncbi:MAG: hypothetical protein QQN41_09690 [Nitrosopumilus sp.]
MLREDFKILCDQHFDKLFTDAKEKNEKQFFTSFFGFRKYGDYRILSYIIDFEFQEIIELIKSLDSAQKIEEIDKRTKVRIALLVYCHIIEVDFIYMVIFNLLYTIRGEDYDTLITFKSKNGDVIKVEYPSKKIKLINEKSEEVGIPLEEIFSEFYFNHLRNSFSHSQYYLHNDGHLQITWHLSPTSSKFMESPHTIESYGFDELIEIYDKSIIYVKSFLGIYDKYMIDYQDGKYHETIYYPLKYDKKHGWVFPGQVD